MGGCLTLLENWETGWNLVLDTLIDTHTALVIMDRHLKKNKALSACLVSTMGNCLRAWSSCSVSSPSHWLRGDAALLLSVLFSFCQSGPFGPNVCFSWVHA